MASTYKRPKGRALLGKVRRRSRRRVNERDLRQGWPFGSKRPHAQALAALAPRLSVTRLGNRTGSTAQRRVAFCEFKGSTRTEGDTPLRGVSGANTQKSYRSVRQLMEAALSLPDSMLMSKPRVSRYLSVTTWPVPTSETP